MLADMLGAMGELVMLKFVVDGICSLMRGYEPNIFNHMYFLREVFDV